MVVESQVVVIMSVKLIQIHKAIGSWILCKAGCIIEHVLVVNSSICFNICCWIGLDVASNGWKRWSIVPCCCQGSCPLCVVHFIPEYARALAISTSSRRGGSVVSLLPTRNSKLGFGLPIQIQFTIGKQLRKFKNEHIFSFHSNNRFGKWTTRNTNMEVGIGYYSELTMAHRLESHP